MRQGEYKTVASKYATVEEARERYRLGRSILLGIAEECGAIRRIGRLIRIDVTKMDKVLDAKC